MTREERREHLLESAAALVAERGFDAISMEGVAARAEVSKALPYSHFENAEALLAALRDRELATLAHRTRDAAAAASGFEAKVEAIVHEFFETVKDRGQVMTTILRWLPYFEARVMDQPPPPASADDWYFAELLEQELGLSTPAARVAQRMVAMGLLGAFDAWTEGEASQATAERVAVRMVIEGASAVGVDKVLVSARRPAHRGGHARR